MGVFDGKGGRGERAHPGSSLGEGTGEGFTGVVADLVRLSPVSASGRSLSKSLPGLLPGPEAVPLKGLKDPVGCLEVKGQGRCDEGTAKNRHRLPESNSSLAGRKVQEPVLWREGELIADCSGCGSSVARVSDEHGLQFVLRNDGHPKRGGFVPL